MSPSKSLAFFHHFDPREEQILQALAQLVQQHPELQAQAGQQQAA
jgi:hypothetical protein